MVIGKQTLFAEYTVFGGICKNCGKPVLHIMKNYVKPGKHETVPFQFGKVCCPSCGSAFEHMDDVTVYEKYEDAMKWVFFCLNIKEGDYYTYSEQYSYSKCLTRSKAFEKTTVVNLGAIAVLDTADICEIRVRVDKKSSCGKRCDKCGYENLSGSKFCIYCGSPLNRGSRLTGN